MQIDEPRNPPPSEPDDQAAGATPYDLIGGGTKVFALVDRFYDLMDGIAVAEPLKTKLMESFFGTAGWMRNKEE